MRAFPQSPGARARSLAFTHTLRRKISVSIFEELNAFRVRALISQAFRACHNARIVCVYVIEEDAMTREGGVRGRYAYDGADDRSQDDRRTTLATDIAITGRNWDAPWMDSMDSMDDLARAVATDYGGIRSSLQRQHAIRKRARNVRRNG